MAVRNINTLSRVEMEMIEKIQKGYSAERIAESLHISSKKVQTCQYNIKRKLRLKSMAGLMAYIVDMHLELYERYAV